MDPNFDLGALTEQAAQVVVKGFLTGAATALRDRLVQLFTRGNSTEEPTVEERRLDEMSKQLEAASDDEQHNVAERLTTSWQRRLLVFLEDHPEAAEELQQIVADFAPDEDEEATKPRSVSAAAGDNSIVIASGRNTNIKGGVQR
ncbi:hypothetical protein [Amycolatopsis thailandensis]|uniref:hypothetical protein n=1 Tax=Amycolatopsis thailandensis TaxID=589330 RepID=UPI00362F592E